MILSVILQVFNVLLVQSQIYETDRKDSNQFLQTTLSFDNTYEQSKEIVETKRESCIDEYQQHKSYRRNPILPSYCKQYCTETTDCQQENELSACTNPLYPPWPSRLLKFVQKIRRMCYIRITEILLYEHAEQMCQRHGVQMAIIDNVQLLEQLKQMNMFNTTCKGQCPETRGYSIGLRRYKDEKGISPLKWIWSDNFTWVQNETDCDDKYSETSFPNATLLCYMGSDGKKKVTVWNTGEPNDRQFGEFQRVEQCVEIIGRPDKKGSFEQVGKLNDISCMKPTSGVLCQMNDLKPINVTQFRSFSKIFGFTIAENDTDYLWDYLLSNFKSSFSPNLESMKLIITVLEKLCILPSFTVEQAINVLNIVDQLINITGKIEDDNVLLRAVTNKLLHVIDIFPAKIKIDKNEEIASFKFDHMSTSLIKINFDRWQHENKDNDWYTITPENSDEHPNSIVQLNMRILRTQIESTNDYRLIETVFSNFNLFPLTNKTHETSENRNQLIGMPISIRIANLTKIRADSDLVRFQIRINQYIQASKISCVYWSFDEDNGSWIADNGCRLIGYIDQYAQCSCNHLTHFALLLQSESKEMENPLLTTDDSILTFASYIGISLSLFGLVVTLITYALFRCSHIDRLHASLIMVCLSVLLVISFFIPFSLTKPNRFGTKNNCLCNIFGFLLHYFLLTSFMWMFILTCVHYMHFVRIFNSHVSHFFIKANIIGWILPLIFPSLVLIIGKDDGYVGELKCWINNEILRYATFLAPISTIIFFNLILFIFAFKGICRRDSPLPVDQHKMSKIEIKAAFCCFISMGITWFFGILVLMQPIFLYQLIFCISIAIQGFLILFFHVHLCKPKRGFWKIFFIQRGFHQRHHSFTAPSDPKTISGSNRENITTLKRPVELRITPIATADDNKKEMSGEKNPKCKDQNEDNTTRKEQTQAKNARQSVISMQPHSLSDRIQKSKMIMNSYA
ncbi:unnamed protein product [Rotaria magnacalcarata]|uniref:Uncharacterized protein n=3 Tax=Rotaria magnacalcarata TaxID=392030 RepID=A0A815RWH2_9BILA|nr:unnamed protein product [Rotaria magnacalcarata]